MRRYMIAGIALLAVIVAGIILHPGDPQHQTQDNKDNSYEYYYTNDDDEEDSLLPEDLSSILADNRTVPLDTIPSSKTVLVNRRYLLPSTYVPAKLVEPNVKFSFTYSNDKRKLRKVAATALENLFQAGLENGVELYGVSGYRSYARQKEIYDRNIATRGQSATDAVSAMPGSSEHQTGLSIDVSAKSVAYRLDQSFGDTKEGRWLAKNAHLHGFIIRYPYGKSDITGYSYEPWHIRFVGKAVATYLYENKLTMEEYYGVENEMPARESAKPVGVDVEDPDSVTYATPRPTRKPSPTKPPKKKPKSTKKPAAKTTKPARKTNAPKATQAPAAPQPVTPADPVSTPKPEPEPPAATPAPNNLTDEESKPTPQAAGENTTASS